MSFHVFEAFLKRDSAVKLWLSEFVRVNNEMIGVGLVGSEMCIRDRGLFLDKMRYSNDFKAYQSTLSIMGVRGTLAKRFINCLLYTSDAADE